MIAFGQKMVLLDGAMGTMLQRSGLKAGQMPELWNITEPDIIKEIHARYLKAGSDIITANTFGCNRLKLEGSGYSVERIITAAVGCAKAAIGETAPGQGRLVALDVGPTGKLLKPLGDLGFEDACSIYKEVITAGVSAGADVILIETMSDAYELKAAVLAAKENCDVPVIASVTFDKNGKMLTGGGADCVVALLEGLRVDAIGINCGFGPRTMMPYLDALLRYSSTPIMFMPNAGMPKHSDGGTVFDVDAQEFSRWMETAAEKGASMLGGCCGTMPEYIAAMQHLKGASIDGVPEKARTTACSYGRAVSFGQETVLIGERINPTGKSRLKQALREKDYDFVLREGIKQHEQGAHALDVNAGLPDIDERETLKTLVERLHSVTDLPLVIDSADADCIEAAMRIYNGKPIINSINGKARSMDTIFPLVQRYGGLIIALTLDESGIPETAGGRLDIAKKIVKRAEQYGIGRHEFLFDPLTLALSAGDDNARVTLETVELLNSELGVKTSLGISNVSFGLPRRDILNAAFLSVAVEKGLSAAIVNPAAPGIKEIAGGGEFGDISEEVTDALMGRDTACQRYIRLYGGQQQPDKKTADKSDGEDTSLKSAIMSGLKIGAAECAARELLACEPLELIERELVPALNSVGEGFEKGEIFLPQLLMSADAAKAAFEVIREKIGTSGTSRGTVVVATVEGDVHDIGKNIARAMLENYNFKVIDLGKDVLAKEVVAAVVEHNVKLLGLSALMTTTVVNMAGTIAAVKEAAPHCKIMCGGAVLTEEYAKDIGADCFVRDAMASVRYAQETFS